MTDQKRKLYTYRVLESQLEKEFHHHKIEAPTDLNAAEMFCYLAGGSSVDDDLTVCMSGISGKTLLAYTDDDGTIFTLTLRLDGTLLYDIPKSD